MGIEAEGFRLLNRVSKIVGQIILQDWDRKKLSSHLGSHLPCFFFFVVVRTIEGQREGANWI